MSGKLIFHYGTVCSSKTLNLLVIAHNYDLCGWNVCTIKPELDTRSDLIETRAQMTPRKADIIIKGSNSLFDFKDVIIQADVILVDECQFLTSEQIDELRNISVNYEVDIICFGLRTDYRTHLFPASKRLFELADEIIEDKTICSVCGKRAGFNAKLNMSNSVHTDKSVIEPSWDAFEQRCWKHYKDN